MTERTHPAAIDVGGASYLRDAKGALIPLAAIKAQDLLMDETVREMLADAHALEAQIAAFKRRSFERVTALQELMAQEYDATVGGKKGNLTLLTFDGCGKVTVQVSDLLEFGPELQAAKTLVDECLTEWSEGSAHEMRALVNRVFQVDQQGKINRGALFMLLRVETTNPRWKRAMDAIRDSMRVVGSKTYMRFYDRGQPDAAWGVVSLDMASA
jgi:hypothetical protein